MPSTYSQQMQRIANEYFAEVGYEGATARDIARWAIATGRWQPQSSFVEERCAEDLADAMREEHVVDPQGRSVRAKHAARVLQNGQQRMLWNDLEHASHDHMRRAFQLRRQQVAGECFNLKQDVDSYNDNRKPPTRIALPLDFTLDVAEMEAERDTRRRAS